MGDRYELDVRCAYCKKRNFDIWYAPTCSSMTFQCDGCKKICFIDEYFNVKKVEDVKLKDVENAIKMASNMMNEKQIKSCAKSFFIEEIKKECSSSNILQGGVAPDRIKS